MRLRLKVLLILASMWAMISLTIYVYSRSTLINDYAQLEKKEVINDIERTRKTLNSLMSSLNLLNTDWSQWNDAYSFMKNKNKAFIKSNLAFTTFENAKINLILFFDTSGKLFYGLNYDLSKKAFEPIPKDLLAYLSTERSFTQHNDVKSNKMGITKTNEGYVVLSSLPIITSEGKGPPHGTLIMGYFFTDRQIEKLSEIVNMQVHFLPLPLNPHDTVFDTAYKNLERGDRYYIEVDPSSQKIIYGFSLIYDIDNHPVGILRITSPRAIYIQGSKTIERYLAIVISIGIIFLTSIWYLLKSFILDRLINVSRQVVSINSESKFSNRIKISGKDELSQMVSAINSLMEIIELTQEQLRYRIFLRTEELERLSKLNKNLYTEMTHQKEIETKLREDEKVLRHMAYYDALTGLPNRLFFNEILKKILAKSERDGMGIAIVFLDADKFKSINDTYGHDIGDKFLQYVAQQLKNSIKESDAVARIAGDEFIICLSNVRGKSLINSIVDKILRHISLPLKIGTIEISSTFSLGIATPTNDGTTIEELEKRADLAMYYAKKRSGNAYFYYDEIEKENVLQQ